MATQMATLFRALLLLFTLSDSFGRICCHGVGINYGQIANNLPSPSRVAYLLRSLNISRVKLYDADPNVLSSFANSEVEFVIGLGNEYLEKMTDPVQAQSWIQQHVQPYISQTKITCITVGNEILTGNDTQLMSNLFPAMQTIYGALSNLGLSKEVYVTTAHSIGILDNPGQVSLEYVLFQPNPGTMDPITNLKYDNMLYAQIDAVYSAIKAMGRTDVQVKISETGWPSKGDPNEVGATPQNAKLYNSNLLSRLQQNEGTPANPSVPVEVYVFALFNENLKPGPASERNYGLYYPDGTPVYDIGIRGFLPRMAYAASWKNELSFFVLFLSLASLICTL
ncbi:glucan endo-1,3-beta-glucosidase 14 [Olea europaea subsp. europaea]|uniref:Glucan endo-1,3-beta-glucosidase 14 n=1 Tax=Olea europaea subsp. europaea TaxID=158383 RepID=A0A8S0RQG3_OLEEU|nr:glucan endo-1,3-beta-glucosidase 14 [Olea europaea subsp. europaea]